MIGKLSRTDIAIIVLFAMIISLFLYTISINRELDQYMTAQTDMLLELDNLINKQVGLITILTDNYSPCECECM